MSAQTEQATAECSAHAPTPECKGLVFWPIPKFSDLELGFGAREESFFNRRDLPEVPRQHRDAAMALFYSGGKLPEFDPRVDRILAMRAVKAWLGSWAPAHESKEATVGYAFWLWSTPEALGPALTEAR